MWKSAKYSMLAVLHFAAGTAHNGRRLAPLPKGGESMPITLTFHVLGFTITVTVKSKNRHPGR